MSKPSFYISCPFDTYSGYGARSRDIVKAIIDLDRYDVKLLSQMWGSTSWGFIKDNPEWAFLKDYAIPGFDAREVKPDIWMQITIPNEFQPLGRYNIGCTAGIESTGCDAKWVEGLNRMDMNWVSSNHSKKVFEGVAFDIMDNKTNKKTGQQLKLNKPMFTVFEGANLDVYKHIESKDITLDLSEIKEQFLFLVVGHWMQGDVGHDRKNIGLTVKAFFETFKNSRGATPALLLKCSNGADNAISRQALLDKIKSIKKTVKGKLPNVYLMTGELENSEMNELYNHPKVKAMVSFTKGEGFGRPLMEFCLSKKPVIASGWSGQLDFLNSNFTTLLPGKLEDVHPSAANQWLVKGTRWFAPDLPSMGKSFKNVYSKYKNYIVPARKQGHHIRENFSWKKMKDLVGEILLNNTPKEFPKQTALKMPTLNNPSNIQLPKIQ